MLNTKQQATLGICLMAVVWGPGAAAAEPEATRIIKRAVDNQIFNLPGAQMQMVMLLRDRQGEVRRQVMSAQTLRRGGLNRTLIRFTAPPEVVGTAFLFLENRDREDDQHTYMPALKVVRRIVGSQKDASFMGSDFSYADLESRDLEEARHRQLADEELAGAACHVIDAVPRRREAYSKLRTWIRKSDGVFLKTKFFDRRGRLLKVLFVKQISKVGQMKVPTRIKLTNKRTGHSTLLEVPSIRPRGDLREEAFTVRALRR